MDGALAVPFVTWGQACSGIALWQMAAALKNKGFKIAGAAKVLAEYSILFPNSTGIASIALIVFASVRKMP